MFILSFFSSFSPLHSVGEHVKAIYLKPKIQKKKNQLDRINKINRMIAAKERKE